MGIDVLKRDLEHINTLLKNIAMLFQQLNYVKDEEVKRFIESALRAFITQIKLINDSIPTLLTTISIEEKKEKSELLEQLQLPLGVISLNKKDKKRFLEELKISEEALRKINKRRKRVREKKQDLFKKPNNFVILASRLFSRYSFKLSDAGFQKLKESLRKSNISLLPSTYISLALFSALLVFIFTILLAILLSFFDIKLIIGKMYPVISFLGFENVGIRLIKNILISLLFPMLTLMLFYLYPISQAASIKKKIESELPFAVIYMSSIAGSGVEPSKVFRILSTSKEYPIISKEFRKIMNQINLYGYDLVTALNNVSKSTSSDKLAELLKGIATNIAEGGNLQDYLNKKAEETLLDYKLERKKYSNIAETSMDIYIGILIAAPLIFMVLLILMNVTGMTLGLSIQAMTYLIIAAIIIINILFLLFLQFKQPT